MEELDLGSILNEEEINRLLSSDEEENDETPEESGEESEVTETNQDDMSESVGDNEENEDEEEEEKEDTPADQDTGSSDFFSSIASAFKAEGIFDISDEDIAKVKTGEDFKSLVEEKIKSELDEQQRRVIEALDNNVEVSEVRQYETTLQYLKSLKDSDLEDESDKGEDLRKRLILQDLLNRGFSKERAEKQVERSFNNGTDIEDAKEALLGNKEFIEKQYEDIRNNARETQRKANEENQKRITQLQKDFESKDVDLFKGMSLSKDLRKKALDAALKPSFKDPKTGRMMTAIQKMQMDDPDGYLLKLGLLYSVTNGFTSFDGVVKNKVNKEIKKGFSELESKLNTTRRDSAGNLKYTSGVAADGESFLGKGIKPGW